VKRATERGTTRLIQRVAFAIAVALMGLAIQVGGTPPAHAMAINVCGSCTYTTIQSAINAAPGGSVIFIAGGTYTEHLSIPGGGTASSLTLWATTPATVDGLGPGSVLTMNTGSMVTLKNLTLTDGSAVNGGGIDDEGGSLTLFNSVVENSSASGLGGGIYSNQGAVTLQGSSSVHNDLATTDGGGIYSFVGTVSTQGTSTIHANSANAGGGIYDFFGTTLIEDGSSVYSNTSFRQAGGIFEDGGTLALEDQSTVHDNLAKSGDGGGIFVQEGFLGGPASLTMLSTSSVYKNRASVGGGIFNEGAMTTFASSSVHDNSAGNGGGIFNTGTLAVRGTSSIYHNNAASGGGIENNFLGALGIGYSIRKNGLPANAASVTVQDFSTIHDNSAGQLGGGIDNEATPPCAHSASLICANVAPSGGVVVQDGASVYHNVSVYGAGIYNANTLTLQGNGSVHDNTRAVYGGGIYNAGGAETDLRGHSSVHHNGAVFGGGIYSSSGTVNLFDNTTLHDNLASVFGGGIYQDGGTLTLQNFSVVTRNSATGDGGGIYGANSPTVALWGVNAVTSNTPNNCFPVGAFPPCAG
jgi:fibronectin-binding autotransporter adhesin